VREHNSLHFEFYSTFIFTCSIPNFYDLYFIFFLLRIKIASRQALGKLQAILLPLARWPAHPRAATSQLQSSDQPPQPPLQTRLSPRVLQPTTKPCSSPLLSLAHHAGCELRNCYKRGLDVNHCADQETGEAHHCAADQVCTRTSLSHAHCALLSSRATLRASLVSFAKGWEN
jgi:hypothetical protein